MRRFRNRCFVREQLMPIYEYRCDNCGHEFETIQKVSEAPLTTCPACEKEALRKKVSAVAFRLKGGGWYETDFKGDKKRNVAGEEKAASDGEGAKAADGGKEGKEGKDKDSGQKPAENTTSKAGEKSGKSGGDSSKSTSEGKSAGKGAGTGAGKSATKKAD